MMISQGSSTVKHVPVLIVGGGITGLSAALFLQEQGIEFLLVERHRGTSIHPRARTIDIRTMELFRELNLSTALREAGKALAPAWGILRGHTLVETLNTTQSPIVGKVNFPSQLAGFEKQAALSPESGCRCTQDLSEVILRESAVKRGGDLRFYHELVRFEQDEQRVSATIRDRQTGSEQALTADYLIAADGANSLLRKTVQAATTGPGSLGDFLNIYFEADLADLVRGREFSQFLIEEPQLTGFLLTINNSNRWTFQLRYYPENNETPDDFSADRLISILQTVIGIPDLPIRLLSVLPWQLTVRVAEQLQHGRVFLVGDAAHTMTPYAGKGANAGVQDVHNLAWKLAAVLNGQAGPALLHTYDPERQPVGAFYARLSGEMADHNGLVKEREMMKNVDKLIGLPNFTYRSTAIHSEPADDTEADYFTGQPGTRLPHLWLDEAKQQSTLDWLNGQFALIITAVTPERSRWQSADTLVQSQLGIHLSVHTCSTDGWEQLTHTQPDDALLVRPDGFVALRLTATDNPTFLVDTLRSLLN